MLGQRYTVKKGDTLWDLAGKYLDKNTDWPKIFEHNNQPQVVASTGKKIVNPDLIYIGQTIYIPPKAIATAQPKPIIKSPITTQKPNAGKKPAVPFKGVPFAYKLSDLPSSKVASPAFIAEIRLTGTITIQRKDASDILAFAASKEQLIMSSKHETDMTLNKLVTQNEVGWNPKTKELTFENGITINSNIPYSPSFTIAAGISSKTQLPVIKASANCAPIKGKLGVFVYAIADLGIEIELTPRPIDANPRPVPITHNAPTTTINWNYLKGALLLTGAVVLVVATLAEDVGTGGAGIADDAVSFASASAIFTTGLSMFKTVPGQHPIKMEAAEI